MKFASMPQNQASGGENRMIIDFLKCKICYENIRIRHYWNVITNPAEKITIYNFKIWSWSSFCCWLPLSSLILAEVTALGEHVLCAPAAQVLALLMLLHGVHNPQYGIKLVVSVLLDIKAEVMPITWVTTQLLRLMQIPSILE